MPQRKRQGLTRLTRYLRGQRARVAALAVIGICSAAAPVTAGKLVQDAIDEGMSKADRGRLELDVPDGEDHRPPIASAESGASRSALR